MAYIYILNNALLIAYYTDKYCVHATQTLVGFKPTGTYCNTIYHLLLTGTLVYKYI